MTSAGGPDTPVTPVPPAPRARPDAGHLDLDAECLEDPVHCGDARHQHDAHAAHPPAAEGAQAG